MELGIWFRLAKLVIILILSYVYSTSSIAQGRIIATLDFNARISEPLYQQKPVNKLNCLCLQLESRKAHYVIT